MANGSIFVTVAIRFSRFLSLAGSILPLKFLGTESGTLGTVQAYTSHNIEVLRKSF